MDKPSERPAEYTPELIRSYNELRGTIDGNNHQIFDLVNKIDGVKDKKVLDLGCGDGTYAFKLKELGAKFVVGIDITEEQIKIAVSKITKEDKDKISFVVADGKRLPFGDKIFDTVFSNFVIHYFSDFSLVFKEIERVLLPGGSFVGTFNICTVEEDAQNLVNTQMPVRLGGESSPVIVYNLIKTREEFESAISEAGLEIVEEMAIDHPNAIIDSAYQHKDKVKKHAMLFHLRKK